MKENDKLSLLANFTTFWFFMWYWMFFHATLSYDNAIRWCMPLSDHKRHQCFFSKCYLLFGESKWQLIMRRTKQLSQVLPRMISTPLVLKVYVDHLCGQSEIVLNKECVSDLFPFINKWKQRNTILLNQFFRSVISRGEKYSLEISEIFVRWS